MCTEAGLRVGMTSNGENVAPIAAACARAGLERINFSVFGTTAAELAQVQHEKFADTRRASRKIAALRDSVRAALDHGLGASANIVVPNYAHSTRVRRLIEDYAPELSVRLLNSLEAGAESVEAIERILRELDAVPLAHHVSAGVSGWRTSYRLPGGRVLWFKRIRPVRLPNTCLGCRFNNGTDCHEGYYGLRLYRDRAGGFQVGVCIQRMDLCLPIGEFLGSALARGSSSCARTSTFACPPSPLERKGFLMQVEYEAKVLGIDPAATAEAIIASGGRRRAATALLRRYVYDVAPGDNRRWIRLRDNGSGSSVTVKEIRHDGIDGTDEVGVGVSSFETAAELLDRLGFAARSYQENRRTSFELEGALLEIDEWPLIPPYLEIEAHSREEVVRVAALLGYAEEELTGENTVKIYARHGIDLLSLKRVGFND